MHFRGQKMVDGTTLADYGIEDNDVSDIIDDEHDAEYVGKDEGVSPVLVKVKQVELDYDAVYLNNDEEGDIRIVVDTNSEIDTLKMAVCEAFLKESDGRNIVSPQALTLYFRSKVLQEGTLADYGFDPKHDYLYVEGEGADKPSRINLLWIGSRSNRKHNFPVQSDMTIKDFKTMLFNECHGIELDCDEQDWTDSHRIKLAHSGQRLYDESQTFDYYKMNNDNGIPYEITFAHTLNAGMPAGT
jgi:hypothetical protein